MNNFIKNFTVVVLLGVIAFFIWKRNQTEEPLAPQGLMETTKMEKVKKVEKVEKVENYSKTVPKLIFNRVKSLEKLAFYQAEAIKNKKFLMLYFYSNGCYYCEKMKNITFSDSRVQKELSENYMVVTVNYSEEKEIFKEKFNLHATPAILFFDQEGNSMLEDGLHGYQGAEDFFNKIELLAEPF